MATANFDWSQELERTVTQSLVTTFGLDFLLLEDKKGGDVDTIHNARNNIWATSEAENNYKNCPNYKETRINGKDNEIKEDRYHTDPRFRNKAKQDKEKRTEGNLHDGYRNKQAGKDEKTQLDHIISSSEIHNDQGRILAGVDGIELSVADSNLVSTHYYINNRKSDMMMKDFVEKEIPNIIENKKKSIKTKEEKLKSIPRDTPEQRNKARKLEDSIRKEKEHIKALKECDKEAMIEADKKARSEYNQKINWTYYTGSKFFKDTALAAGKSGLKMGTRQAETFAKIYY